MAARVCTMTRYVAFLRGVSPRNAKNADLQASFEAAGFTDVRTVLASGNVVFGTARAAAHATLERRAEKAMQDHLGRSFAAIVRPCLFLQELIASDPYAGHPLPAGAKRVVTFLRQPSKRHLDLPIRSDGARILAMTDGEVFTDYIPGPHGPAFMVLLEKTFGKAITTRTLDTVRKCAAA